MRTLNTYDQVIKALGGTTEAGRLIGRRPANLCQWRTKYGRFPAALWFRVNDVLAQRGCEASATVFRFETPRKR